MRTFRCCTRVKKERSPASRIILCVLFSLVAGLGILFSCAHPSRTGDAGIENTDALLDQIRRATGYQTLRSLEGGLFVEGRGEYLGLPAIFRMYFSPQGPYRSEIVSRLTLIEGFDGERGWMVDETGMPGHLALTSLEQSRFMAWITGGYWLDPECPLIIEMQPWSPGDTAVVLSLRLPNGILQAALAIDPQTFLPRRCQWTSFDQESFIEWLHWDGAGGFPFPGEILSWAEFQEIRIRVDTARAIGESGADLFRPITRRPEDTRFYSSRGSAVQLIRIPSGNMAVQPQVNGQEAGWFLLDTGAGRSVIDIALADSLEMETIGELPAMGFGGLVNVHYRIGENLTLGPVEIERPTFLEIDLSPLRAAFGMDIDGILGYDLFMRSLVELDVTGDSLRLSEPGTWDALEADWQEVTFHRNAPLLSCSFPGGHTALFDLDTGFPGQVTFGRSFAEQHGLLDELELETFTAGGVGGMMEMHSGVLEWFELDGHRWEQVPISVAGEAQGVLADEAVAGLIGTGLLSPYRVLIDYPNKRIALVEKE